MAPASNVCWKCSTGTPGPVVHTLVPDLNVALESGRMHDQICDFPSKTLYHAKLKSHESVASHLLSDLPNAEAKSEEDEKEYLQTPVVFFDTAGCEYFERLEGDGDEGSRCNENEATIVHNWVEKLVGY
jgi:DNA polymerase alpha-associated DNA helicase A